VSPGTRFEEMDSKATNRPVALIAGRVSPEAEPPPVPSPATLT